MKFLIKIVPVLLLGAMIFAGARYFVFSTMIQLNKWEFRQQALNDNNVGCKQLLIAHEDLHKNSKDLVWAENNNEIILNNLYYEVLSTVRNSDHYIVTIKSDDAENGLFKLYFDNELSEDNVEDDILLEFSIECVMPNGKKLSSSPTTQMFFINCYEDAIVEGFCSGIIKPPRAIKQQIV